MAEDNKNKGSPKKGLPGGFLVILLAGILLFFSIQSMNKEKAGKVSFSHQVEHLVNLDLVQKDNSRKTAQIGRAHV
jgi:cell division protease FtsH